MRNDISGNGADGPPSIGGVERGPIRSSLFAPASRRIAALFVANGGCYFGLDGVDAWDVARDARDYAGPHPVVAHPPCERWGRMWFGSPRKPDRNKYRLGDDGGCFAAALAAVRRWGGVLEHPTDSLAWDAFGLIKPPRSGGWTVADWEGGWTCCIEQGHYGNRGRKATWLYAMGTELPSLRWGSSGQRLDPVLLKTRGYEYARRCGITGALGGKWKKEHRAATPPEFRDVLIAIARSVKRDLAVCIPPDGRLQASSEIAAAGSLAGPLGGVAEIDKVLALHGVQRMPSESLDVETSEGA